MRASLSSLLLLLVHSLPAALTGFRPSRADGNDPRAALLVEDEHGQRRVVELPALTSFALAGDARLLRTTARHVVAYDSTRGLSAAVRGQPLRPLVGGKVAVFDLVDGDGGSSWLAGATSGHVFVGQLDRRGQLTVAAVMPAARTVLRVSLVRTSGGFVVAWLGWSERGPSTLMVARLDGKGALLGAPLPLDVADGEQPMADVALAADGDANGDANGDNGVVVAWDPIVGRAVGELLPVELRAFRLTRDRPPALLRKLPLHTIAWVVAGSAGGVLANDLQAVSVGGRALLVWSDFDAKQEPLLRALLADGGEPIVAGSGLRSPPLLRARPGGAVVALVDTQPRVDTIALTVGADGCPISTATPWTPPPAEPASADADRPPTRAECEQLVARFLTLAAADAEAKKQLPDMRAHQKDLVNQCRIEMSRAAYECAQKAPTYSAADGCE